MQIKELKAKDTVDCAFLLKKCELKSAKNAKEYLDVIASDRTGEISGKMWDVSGVDMQGLHAGVCAHIRASVEVYQTSLQLRIQSIEKTEVSEREMNNLVQSAPYSSIKMYEKLYEQCETIKNRDIREITLSILEERKEKLLYYPAAKTFHHALKGGLLYHTYSMLRSAAALLEIYDFLNRDLVYAGVVLHDLGKIEEMQAEQTGIVEKYTVEGNLLGHIITMICVIDRKGLELGADPEVVLLLKHMILSHHEQAEFGSPKPPMFPEAELLHHVDVLDARMNQMQSAVGNAKEHEFCERVYALDGRNIYNHGLKNE